MTEDPEPKGDVPEDEQERWEVLTQLEDWLERPMLLLSFIWLSLVLIELTGTTSGVFELLGTIIRIIFILEFLLRFALAPRKIRQTRAEPTEADHGRVRVVDPWREGAPKNLDELIGEDQNVLDISPVGPLRVAVAHACAAAGSLVAAFASASFRP